MFNFLLSKEFITRLISAVLFGLLVIWAIIKGGEQFHLMVVIAGLLMMVEWIMLVNKPKQKLSASRRFVWYVAGFAYVLASTMCIMYLRETLFEGVMWVLWLFVVVWATDIGAYIVGLSLRGPKIAPSISPKKTWSGLLGGMLSATIACYLFGNSWTQRSFELVCHGPIIGVIAQVGDFFESWVKRYFGAKDSGFLIPGHGGVLDRVDGLVTVSIYMYFLSLIYG